VHRPLLAVEHADTLPPSIKERTLSRSRNRASELRRLSYEAEMSNMFEDMEIGRHHR
jgi:hypothetical protein